MRKLLLTILLMLTAVMLTACAVETPEEVSELKEQIASLNTQLSEKQTTITDLETQVDKLEELLEEATTPVPTGETSEPSVPVGETTAEPTKVTTIDIGWPMSENWDADPEVDGIEFDLEPKDAEDKTVETPGVVSAKLWLEKSVFEGGGKGDLVQEWSNIQVTKNDYEWPWGVTIRLEYKGFEPEEMEWGVLEVTLVTPDGKSFTARASSVMLD